MNDQIIVTTIYALSCGMNKDWVSKDFVEEFNKITKMHIGSMDEIHRVHKAARKALDTLNKVHARYGWDNVHVELLCQTFADYARYSDPQ